MVMVKSPMKNSYILMVPSLPLLWLKSSWARPTSTSTSGLASLPVSRTWDRCGTRHEKNPCSSEMLVDQ